MSRSTRGRAPSARMAPTAHTHPSQPNGIERQRVANIQRTRMLAAMFDVVAELGAANASVAHVVARSGVSRRTFYELFADREDCFLAAFDEAVGCAEERVTRAYEAAGAPWRERVRAGLFALLGFFDEEPSMARLLVVETLAAGPRALERRQRMLERVEQAVDMGRTQSRAVQEPSSLAAEGLVGAVFSVVHARMVGRERASFSELGRPLMSMIALPYLGSAAARRELEKPPPQPAPSPERPRTPSCDPLRSLELRLTYRTVRVLLALAANPHASNRRIAGAAGVSDQGQMSKLLTRLRRLGLVENSGGRSERGGPNSWVLTGRGRQVVEQTIHAQGRQVVEQTIHAQGERSS